MPTDDKWTRERATQLAIEVALCSIHSLRIDVLTAALQEAIDRTHSEERALVAEEVKKQLKLADKTIRVMANDLRIADNAVKAAEAKLARLRNPDEALVDAVRRAEPRIDNVVCRKLSRAIAVTLDEPTPKCSTCNDTGEVDQRLGGAPLYGIVSCPDCTPEKKENS